MWLKKFLAGGAVAVLIGGAAILGASAQADRRADVGGSPDVDALIREARGRLGDAQLCARIAKALAAEDRMLEAGEWIARADAIEQARAIARGGQESNQRGEPSVGPDVIVGEIVDLFRIGQVSAQETTAYAIGTIACNIGDSPASWISTNPGHPVISQTMHRLKDGRFEQIGMAWLKHGFIVAAEEYCGTCSNLLATNMLHPGCSDTYVAMLNGTRDLMGPHIEVNGSTGVNRSPHSMVSTSENSTLRARLRVKWPDLLPASNPGARYFVEGYYLAADDTAAGNQHNNASHREITVSWNEFQPSLFPIAFAPGAVTQVGEPAIQAWQDADPNVTLVNIDVAGDGRFILGWNVTDNLDGTWHYEYALYNMSSDRGARSFSVPIPGVADALNIGFHDADYHSGDGDRNGDGMGGDVCPSQEPGCQLNFDPTNWPSALSGGALSWEIHPSFDGPNANALRFTTIYNFRFDSHHPPVPADITIGLYKAGAPGSVTASAAGPDPDPPCVGDLNADGQVGAADLANLLALWGIGASAADLNHDGQVNAFDLANLLALWGPCP